MPAELAAKLMEVVTEWVAKARKVVALRDVLNPVGRQIVQEARPFYSRIH
jgi:uncharacterized protein YjiS (DUF1127 family)